MHYLILKNIIQTTLANFSCPYCQEKADEGSIRIQDLHHEHIMLHIHCPSCHKDTQVKAEVKLVNVSHTPAIEEHHTITDADILKLRKVLKSSPTIQDLLD